MWQHFATLIGLSPQGYFYTMLPIKDNAVVHNTDITNEEAQRDKNRPISRQRSGLLVATIRSC